MKNFLAILGSLVVLAGATEVNPMFSKNQLEMINKYKSLGYDDKTARILAGT